MFLYKYLPSSFLAADNNAVSCTEVGSVALGLASVDRFRKLASVGGISSTAGAGFSTVGAGDGSGAGLSAAGSHLTGGVCMAAVAVAAYWLM